MVFCDEENAMRQSSIVMFSVCLTTASNLLSPIF
jgi:hypothetical protein